MTPGEQMRLAEWLASQSMTQYAEGEYDRWLAVEPVLKFNEQNRFDYFNRQGRIELSVIIVVDENNQKLQETIRSLILNCDRVEVVIVASIDLGCNFEGASNVRIVRVSSEGEVPENPGVKSAKGEFIAFLSQGDLLRPGALRYILDRLETNPDVQMAYSGEDWITAAGRRRMPRFKPKWDPYGQMAFDLPGRLCVMRRDTVLAIGGLRAEATPAHHYDLHIRYAACVGDAGIERWPDILYHRRMPEAAETKHAGNALDLYAMAARRALSDHIRAPAVPAPLAPFVNRPVFSLPNPLPLLSILVPTRDRVDLVRNCVSGILERTDYPHLEVVVIDNDSSEPDTFQYFSELERNPRLRILRISGEFNYSRLNNIGARSVRCDVLLFMNNDVEVISPGWLRDMVALAVREDVGCVGAKLFYGDGTIQHAGVALDHGPFVMHVFGRRAPEELGRNGELAGLSSFSAVTAACLAIRRELFFSVGGFDEKKLQIAYNDVDFCLKVEEAGYHNVCTPYEPLFHLESTSRRPELDPAKLAHDRREFASFATRWKDRFDDDRFGHPFVLRPGGLDERLVVRKEGL